MRFQKVSHLFSLLGSAPCQPIATPNTLAKDLQLFVKRDDLLHPVISGNKWRKLKHLLIYAEEQGYQRLAVMGGRYSNLLHSVSYIAACLNWQLSLYLRGFPQQPMTPMLIDAVRWGAKIEYCCPAQFRQYRDTPPELDDDCLWVGEGGFDALAIKGTMESLMEQPMAYDYLVIASATGTSLAGYCHGVAKLGLKTRVMGVRVLLNDDEIEQNIERLGPCRVKPEIIRGYEFGGYGKKSEQLEPFIGQFYQDHQIPLEPVYNGKSFYAVMDLIHRDYFPPKSRILLVHCGGLQGLRK